MVHTQNTQWLFKSALNDSSHLQSFMLNYKKTLMFPEGEMLQSKGVKNGIHWQ